MLDACLRERYGRGFRHHEHSLRVVEHLEQRSGGERGLNLTAEVREGILRHTGPEPSATLEGRIVRVVDRIAYINHDIDDALRAGVLERRDLPEAAINLLGETGSARIDTLVADLVERSEAAGEVTQGGEIGAAMAGLRTFMFERVYLAQGAQSEHARITRMLRALFEAYAAEPPPEAVPGATPAERVCDYLAGMTDRFAIRAFSELSVPRGF